MSATLQGAGARKYRRITIWSRQLGQSEPDATRINHHQFDRQSTRLFDNVALVLLPRLCQRAHHHARPQGPSIVQARRHDHPDRPLWNCAHRALFSATPLVAPHAARFPNNRGAFTLTRATRLILNRSSGTRRATSSTVASLACRARSRARPHPTSRPTRRRRTRRRRATRRCRT